MRMKILSVGRIEVTTDLSLPYLPSCGHTVQGREIARFPGGSGVDTAIALQKLGTDPVLSGRVGDDANGSKILSYLGAAGVDARYVESDPLFPTGSFVRMTEDGGRVRGIRFDGANRKLSAVDLEFAYNSYPMGSIVSADLPDEAVFAAVLYGAKSSVPVMLCDIFERDKILPLERLKTVEIFLVSADNVVRYTGMEPSGTDRCLRCCIALSTLVHARYYVLKLGERGTFIYDGKYHSIVPYIETEDHGSLSAESYYCAAFMAKYLSSGDVKAAAELATQAEALGRERTGGVSQIPSSDELRSFIRTLKDGEVLRAAVEKSREESAFPV